MATKCKTYGTGNEINSCIAVTENEIKLFFQLYSHICPNRAKLDR